jgi:type II secretion system protein G
MRRNQKGFTLMELMVVIVIVAILAAVAVPLYINYVKDARRTEAKAAIGALATAMEEYFLKNDEYTGDIGVLTQVVNRQTNLDQKTVDEIDAHWDINIVPNGSDGYTMELTGDANAAGYQNLGVRYIYTRGTPAQIEDFEPGGGDEGL